MAGEWKISALGELCEFRAGCVFKPSLQGKCSGDYPFVKVSDMNLPSNSVRLHDANNWVLARDLPELGTKPLPPGSIVFAKIGEALRQNRLRQVIRDTIIDNNMMGVIPRTNRVDASFLYYALSQFDFSTIAHGTALPYLTVSSLSTLTVELPSLLEQRAIAHILGTLDDKIELNRKMAATLEAMARALFRAWFVDFEPVRAKIEGRWQRGQSLPGLPAHLHDLFPDRLVDSELGEIPEGWELAALTELIEVNPTRLLRKADIAPYLDMANLPTQGHAPDEVIERPFGSGMRFINGDTLVARITPCLENGKTAFVDFLQEGQVGWGSTEYIVLRPKPPLPPEFAYCLSRSPAFRDFAIQSMTGTSGRQRVQSNSLSHFMLARVPRLVAEAFGRTVTPLFARSSGAVRESRTFAAIRDALLPKLVSGELRVRDAEAFLEKRGLGARSG
jgi:type I restriction enzyme S subunit